MNIKTAQEAITAILAAIPDDELPEFDRVEYDKQEGRTLVWWGSVGHYLGGAKSKGVRDPLVHRRSAAWAAIEGEMTYRADKRLFDNGDDPTGIKLAAKAVTK